MRAIEARNLWLGELSTNGASPWTIRNYTSATDAAFAAIAERRQAAAADLELGVIDRDDMIASLAAYVERTDASGMKRKQAQSTMSSFATALRSFFTWCVETEKIERNPMAWVKRPKQPIRVPKAMGAEQCQ